MPREVDGDLATNNNLLTSASYKVMITEAVQFTFQLRVYALNL